MRKKIVKETEISKKDIIQKLSQLSKNCQKMVELRKTALVEIRVFIQGLSQERLDKLIKLDTTNLISWTVDKIRRGYFGTDVSPNQLARISSTLLSTIEKA